MGRIISYNEKTAYNNDDYLLIDNKEDGTKRIRADRVGVQLDPSLTDPNKAAPANAVKPVDPTPTQGSTNAVRSGGVYEALAEINETIDGLPDVSFLLPTDTASGSIASFPDGADNIPMKSVKVQIEPVQDLHGQDAPYPAGGGKNLFVYPYSDGSSKTINGVTFTVGSDGTVTANGTATANAEFSIARDIKVNFPAGTYTISGLPSGASATTFVYNSFAGTGNDDSHSDLWDFRIFSDRTVTVKSEIKTLTHSIRIMSGYTANNLVFKPMLENGSSASSFAPYSNICPISGWTGAQVSHSGANVWYEELEKGSINQITGQNVDNPTVARSKNYIQIPQGEQIYTILPWALLFWYRADKSFITCTGTGNPEDGAVYGKLITPPSGACYMRFRCSGTYGTTYNHDISINYPATDTDYHPYTGNTYPITFPTEAGTVYGGTLDVTNGVLTVNRAIETLSEMMCKKSSDLGYATFYATPSNAMASGQTVTLVKSSTWLGVSQKQINKDKDNFVWGSSSDGTIRIKDTACESYTSDEFKTAFADAQFCYELATPITYPLTPTEIKSLLGDNNIWADAGDTEVTYRADTTLYINRKIAEAVSALS